VEVSYAFNLKGGKGQTRMSIYFSGTNLITLSKLRYIDPEAPNVNNGFYPQQKIYNVGLNISM
jgi:hypothetical protein